jgi:DNA-binding HxlR family transcriptional regulator
MVNLRFRDLEAHGFAKREAISAQPIAVTYHTADFGRSVLDVPEQLKAWTEKYGI